MTASGEGAGLLTNETEAHSVCPSSTGTLLQAAETRKGCSACKSNDVESEVIPPRIFVNSHSILASSPWMFGTMLSRMSRDETPGYPAPEIACIVVIMTHSRGPKAFSRALRGIETPVVEQFALVTMNPFERGGDSRDC